MLSTSSASRKNIGAPSSDQCRVAMTRFALCVCSSKRRQLVELEEMELFERDFLANMMAPITSQIAKLVEFAEKRTRLPAS